MTRTGVSLGTLAYMSPEQATGRRDLDGRTDEYALGCVLFEMLAGYPPFTGAEVEAVVRQHVTAEPPSVTEARPTVPVEVDRVILRALAKSPADRFRTTGEMGAALGLTTAPSQATSGFSLRQRPVWQILAGWAVASLVVLGASGTLTDVVGLPAWVPTITGVICLGTLPLVLAAALELHKRLTWRVVGAVVAGAFVLLATGTMGYMGMRVLGIGPLATLLAAGELDAGEPIVLADFETRPFDSKLAYAVTAALGADLSQSPTVRLADDAQVDEVLRLMERDPDALLDFETARGVAIREGLKAVIGGEINAVGSGFVLSTRLVVAETGEELLNEYETADDPNAIIPATQRLSRRLRERIGESLKTIRRTPPLSRVTTPSLEALELHTEAGRANGRGDYERCVKLRTDAIALDSLFGSAYAGRGVCYANMRLHPAQQVADLRRALELRDRMTDLERTKTTDFYYYHVMGEIEKAIEVLEAYLDRHPDHPGGLNLDVRYAALGRYARAEELIRRRLDGGTPLSNNEWSNLTNDQLSQGNYEDAEETLRLWEEAVPGSWLRLRKRFQLAVLRGDDAAAEGFLREWREEYAGGYHQWSTSASLSLLALTRGKLDEAEAHFRNWMEECEAAGSAVDCQGAAIEPAYTPLFLKDDTALARNMLDSALARYPLESMETLDRDYVSLAAASAMAGQPARARALLRELRDSIPPDMWGRFRLQTSWVGGWISLAEGRLEDARVEFQRLEGTQSFLYHRAFGLARTFERMAAPDSAIAHYERFLETPFSGRNGWDPYWLPIALERLGQLHDERGDPAQAAEYYSRFVELWAEADPELQPRVEAARRALERLRAEKTDSIDSG